MAKKKLTKQERQLRQLQREQLHRKAKQDLLNSIEAHDFNKGDLVRVGDKVGVIVSYKQNILNRKWSIGEQAFAKAVCDFYNVVDWWAKTREQDLVPPQLEEHLKEFVPTIQYILEGWAEAEDFQASIDVPVVCIDNGIGVYVRYVSVMFNKQKDQYLLFNEKFDAVSSFDLDPEGDESITTSNETAVPWFEAKGLTMEEATFQGIFSELLDQAYAVKEKRSRNLGLYKVHYTGEMLGQKGKQQVLVAPCNITAV